jgi:hypothetical protein
MPILKTLFLLVFLFPAHVTASVLTNLPGSFMDGSMVRIGEPETWTSDNMYEHVNGEAELLKRYGAIELAYASYESAGGDYLSVDILDMTVPVNAFGLYSLYAGCDGDEYTASGATVLSGDFTSYAVLGRYFLRMDFETGEGREGGRPLVSTFLSELVKVLPKPEQLPPAVGHLKRLARKPCEAGYHPEHMDYDLESGPGYIWTGPDGETYFMSIYASPDKAEDQRAALKKKGIPMVLVRGNVVGWAKTGTEETKTYLNMVLGKAVKW